MNTQEIITEAMNLVQEVQNGERNALDVFPELYELEKSIKELSNELKPLVVEERSKFDRKEDVIKHGYRISVVTTERKRYKHDEHWQSLEAAKKNREALMKKAYEMSKKNQPLVNTETGEIVPPCEVTVTEYPKLESVGVEV